MYRSLVPLQGSIERGKVTRIEPYGAFVHLDRYSKRGYKVEKVEDVVSIDDVVWVKVLDVQEEGPRFKISLSMKGASQDGTAQDLEQQDQEADNQRKSLEQSLNSTIGMGVALDPMAAMSSARNNRLILKNQKPDATVINGYALVDDTEGEPEVPTASNTVTDTTAHVVRPMGRGRGTTLPAWMTQNTAVQGASRSDDDADSIHSKGSKKKSRRKKSKHKEKRKHGKRSSSKRHKRKKEDRKRRRRHHSDSDYDSDHDKKHSKKEGVRSERYKEDRKRGRHHSSSEYSTDDSREDVRFTSVDEAKKLIADLEKNQR